MPRFFFHQITDAGFINDPEGSELLDLAAAREEALAVARELWAQAILAQHDLGDRSYAIVDAHGCHLLTVSFADALPERLRGSME